VQQGKTSVFFQQKDLLSPTRFGQKPLQELNTLTEENFSKPIQDVLIDTPRSRLSKNLQVMNESGKDDEWNAKYEMTCRKTRMNMGMK